MRNFFIKIKCQANHFPKAIPFICSKIIKTEIKSIFSSADSTRIQ